MVDKLKKIIPYPEPQGVLARAVQPPPPPPAPTGAQPSGAPPAPPATDADLDQCYTGGTYYPRPYYPPYQPAPYPYYPYPAPVPPAPVTSPTTSIAQILVSYGSNLAYIIRIKSNNYNYISFSLSPCSLLIQPWRSSYL